MTEGLLTTGLTCCVEDLEPSIKMGTTGFVVGGGALEVDVVRAVQEAAR